MPARKGKEKDGGSVSSATRKPHDLYEIDGDVVKRKRQSCPKCGEGYFLAEHKDRISCGKCGYTEFK